LARFFMVAFSDFSMAVSVRVGFDVGRRFASSSSNIRFIASPPGNSKRSRGDQTKAAIFQHIGFTGFGE
jgi:hypothetical protein